MDFRDWGCWGRSWRIFRKREGVGGIVNIGLGWWMGE